MRVALLYEHPQWSLELLERLQRRNVDVRPIDVGAASYTPHQMSEPCDLWLNRINAMPSSGRSSSVVAAANHLLLALDLANQRVVNGWRAHAIGASKAAQAALFASVDLATPTSLAISDPKALFTTAGFPTLTFPVVTKPNVGGSGRGISRHETAAELGAAIDGGVVDLGLDGTGLVQSVIDSADGLIYRVEILGDELFYATTQPIKAGAFNYCAVDGCHGDDGPGSTITLFSPTPDVVDEARTVLRAAGADLGSVEFLIDDKTGGRVYYDFNPYSNFVTGQNDALGFDPIERYLDYALDPSAELPTTYVPGVAIVD